MFPYTSRPLPTPLVSLVLSILSPFPGTIQKQRPQGPPHECCWRPPSVYHPTPPFWVSCWWPWASGPLANVPALCLWPPPTPPHPLSNHIPNLHGHPATEQKPHPEEKYRPLFQVPLPLHSCLFSRIPPQCCHLFLQQQLRRPQAAACQPRLYQGGRLGQAPGLPLHAECWLWPHTRATRPLLSNSQSPGAWGPCCPFLLDL